MKITFIILILLVSGLQVTAQEGSTATPPADRPEETEILLDPGTETDPGDAVIGGENLPGLGIGDFIRMILILGFVIALVYGFFWLLKRFSGVKAEREDVIHIISTRPLKGDTALHLIETGKRLFLIGGSGNSINLITEIDDKESIDEIRLTASKNPTPANGFNSLIKRRLNSGAGITDAGENKDPAEFLRQQRDRLQDL